jgi:23S rRNA (pseudouridine1915-N3)-methyltransferase
MKSSKQVAEMIGKLETQSISTLSLLLGGAEGHSENLKKQAKELWSLSPLTLPHDLARLVLLEQLYRAETIRAGHPYHRE